MDTDPLSHETIRGETPASSQAAKSALPIEEQLHHITIKYITGILKKQREEKTPKIQL